jgi:hypothetical protein
VDDLVISALAVFESVVPPSCCSRYMIDMSSPSSYSVTSAAPGLSTDCSPLQEVEQ